jgi:hypothetical protein
MIHAKKTMFHVAGGFFRNILIDYLHERKSHKSLISGVAKAQKKKHNGARESPLLKSLPMVEKMEI